MGKISGLEKVERSLAEALAKADGSGKKYKRCHGV